MSLSKGESLALKLVASVVISAVLTHGITYLVVIAKWLPNPELGTNANLLALGLMLLILCVCTYFFVVRGWQAVAFVLFGVLFTIPLILFIALAISDPSWR